MAVYYRTTTFNNCVMFFTLTLFDSFVFFCVNLFETISFDIIRFITQTLLVQQKTNRLIVNNENVLNFLINVFSITLYSVTVLLEKNTCI